MKLTVRVIVGVDRGDLGRFVLTDGAGLTRCSGPVLAKADYARASAEGNPECDPMKPFGDTPAGTYACRVIAASANLRSYGPHRRVLLIPLSGPCVEAKREGLEWHGGDENPLLVKWGGLRPTDGCLRSHNEDMGNVLAIYDEVKPEEFLLELTEA